MELLRLMSAKTFQQPGIGGSNGRFFESARPLKALENPEPAWQIRSSVKRSCESKRQRGHIHKTQHTQSSAAFLHESLKSPDGLEKISNETGAFLDEDLTICQSMFCCCLARYRITIRDNHFLTGDSYDSLPHEHKPQTNHLGVDITS